VNTEVRAGRRRSGAPLADRVVRGTLRGTAWLVGMAVPLLIFLVLTRESLPAFRRFGFWGFLTGRTWDPASEVFGALPALTGSLLVTLLATLLALPVSLGIAIFLTELAPRRLRPLLETAVELLGAIPSIIYGMWGFFVVAPLLAATVEPALQATLGRVPVLKHLVAGVPMGVDALTASLILSIMILPFMSAVIKDAFLMTPPLLKEAGYALGATRWEVITRVMIPYAMPGIVGGTILGVGRAIGETMAVAFLTGNVHRIPTSLLDPLTTITVALANEFTEAHSDLYLSSLFALAWLLMLLSFVLLLGARSGSGEPWGEARP
jgi:phosphate ABC transporter, permease protein PstC